MKKFTEVDKTSPEKNWYFSDNFYFIRLSDLCKNMSDHVFGLGFSKKNLEKISKNKSRKKNLEKKISKKNLEKFFSTNHNFRNFVSIWPRRKFGKIFELLIFINWIKLLNLNFEILKKKFHFPKIWNPKIEFQMELIWFSKISKPC